MIVYTVLKDNYDNLKDPRFIDPEVRYICYSNTPQQTDVWEIVRVDLDDVKDQRKLKIIGYQDFDDDWSCYIDASIEIKASVLNFAYVWDYDLTMLQHRGRNCIYAEADAVMGLKKDTWSNIYPQIKRYIKEDFPRNSGLIQTGLIFRRRNKDLDKFCNAWWREVERGSVRDQLSFNYVCWKLGKEYDIVPFGMFESCFKLYAHASTK